ncbi:F-box/kelch-repeat protein At3g23880-like [Lotus japonicus]|uniref:F-box/kelch-repeat protein At3g23880-like n=1 Tax=Lotus japonicus TaxID=34305 RepID=UPI00258FF5A8|nr:F-box/kelch-repeat protein At3g23880-like [Lotus japonicus]
MMRNSSSNGLVNMNKRTLNLPEELIIQILLRLPVKSIVRFKCVCKSWLSLISDPHFAESNFKLAATTPTHKLLFIANSAPGTRSVDLDHDALSLNSSASTTVKLNFLQLPPSSYSSLGIVGSCRGFLLLHCNANIFLWNPSTGVHNQIPCSPIASNVHAYLYGFGYDPSQDDYLVVLASYERNTADLLKHLEFFSLRANVWKEIKDTHYMNAGFYWNGCDPRVGSLLNNAIHWVAFHHDTVVNHIIAFDLIERRVSEIPLPDDFEQEAINYELWVFRGLLSLWVHHEEDDTVNIWVMERYKVQSSWVITLVVSFSEIPTQYFSPICSTKSGDIVGTDGDKGLVKYNDKGQLLEHHSYDEYPYVSLTMYTESLLSLPVIGGRELAS